MDLNRLTRDADELIRKVVARYNQLYSPFGTISQVELDLMLDDLRKLYDTFKLLGQENLALSANKEARKPAVTINETVNSAPKEVEKAASIPPEPQKPLQKPEPKPEPEPEPEPIPEKNPVQSPEPDIPVMEDDIVENQDTDEVTEIEEMETPAENNFASAQVTNRIENASSTLADKFKDSGKSLSETLAANAAQSGIGSRMVFQPISDLAPAIGLNDKFNFIHNLFSSNAGIYEESINRMNKAVNYDEAMWILQNYKIPSWSENAETLHRLTDFIKRRFI